MAKKLVENYSRRLSHVGISRKKIFRMRFIYVYFENREMEIQFTILDLWLLRELGCNVFLANQKFLNLETSQTRAPISQVKF